jgi:hypothetical protein
MQAVPWTGNRQTAVTLCVLLLVCTYGVQNCTSVCCYWCVHTVCRIVQLCAVTGVYIWCAELYSCVHVRYWYWWCVASNCYSGIVSAYRLYHSLLVSVIVSSRYCSLLVSVIVSSRYCSVCEICSALLWWPVLAQSTEWSMECTYLTFCWMHHGTSVQQDRQDAFLVLSLLWINGI